MSESDYENMMDDELFKGLKPSKYKKRTISEQEYEKQQRTLAEKYGDGNLDFPHLNKDR
jgi:hypothetical protein